MPVADRKDGARLVTQFVNCLGIGGTERQLVEQLRRLDRSRFESDVLCLHKVGEFLDPVREIGFEPTQFDLRGTLLRPNTAVQLLLMARRMRETGAALVHCHDFYSNLVGSTAARLVGLPHIVSRRDLGVWIGPTRAKVLAAVTRRATRVLCNAYAVRDRLVNEEGIDSGRIRVIHNGLDLSRFDREAALPLVTPIPALDGRRPTIALVGNMKHPVKGHADLLLAAAAVVRAVPEARFLLVGDGALRTDLERRARELSIGEHVVFLGRRTDVASILARCTVAVSASHAEGLPNAVMEAMAARLPCVATGVGGTVELVRDGRSGFIVRRGDPSGLAQRLIDLLRQPHLARRMGICGRRRIEEEFTAEAMIAKVTALYAELLEESGGEARRAA